MTKRLLRAAAVNPVARRHLREALVRKGLALLLLALLLPPHLFAQLRSPAEQRAFVLARVTVIDVTGARAKNDMTVVVIDGRIAAVGKDKDIRVPKGARVIDATGKFLIPGLWDMHAHIGNEDYDKEAHLRLFVANGVTGIRIMNGAPEHHLWRKEIESGKLLGPRMFIASRVIDGPKTYLSGVTIVADAAQAREAVRQAKNEGADLVKVHDNVPRDAYFAIAREARLAGLPVGGHVPASLSAAEASDAGQKSIEHFTGLAEAVSDVKKADAIIATLKKNYTWVCPTLIMRNNYASLDDPRLADASRLKYAKPSWRAYWSRLTREAETWPAGEAERRKEGVRRERELIGRMQRAGVGVLAGTDDSNPYVIPGLSIHDELALLVDSGLTPMQALQAATLSPAKFFNKLDQLGSIERGKLADLVLLGANPLEDIHNTTRIEAVVVNGNYLERGALNQILDEIESAAKRK